MSNISINVKLNPYNAKRIGFKAIKDLGHEPTIMRELSDILQISLFDLTGKDKFSDTDLLLHAQSLRGEIKGRFELMTLPEVKEAFRRGIRGESGAFFGMCAKTYNQFLKWYFDLPDRGKSWTEYLDSCQNLQIEGKPKRLSDDELKQACLDAFEDFKKSGKMPFVPFAIYEQIKEFKKVKTLIPVEKWKQVKEDGKKLYETRKTHGMTKRQSEVWLISIRSESEESELSNTIKEVALRAYFSELVSGGYDLVFQ